MTEIRKVLFNRTPPIYVAMNVDTNTASTNKKPSPELFSLIKAAATNLLGFGELWGSIKKKGHDEGFSEKELQDMLRPFLKEKLDSKKVWYLFHADEQKQRSHGQYQNRTNISTNAAREPSEESSTVPVTSVVSNKAPEPVAKEELSMTPSFENENEEPTELELAEIRIAQLEDALRKTQMFKPATQFQEQTDVYGTDETKVFEWLRKRENRINIFFYDNYGIELIQTRLIPQLKNAGVKTFKRLYFEV